MTNNLFYLLNLWTEKSDAKMADKHCLSRKGCAFCSFLDKNEEKMKKNHRFLCAIKYFLYLCGVYCGLVCLCAQNEQVTGLQSKDNSRKTQADFQHQENDGFLNARNERQWDDNQENT